MANQIVAFFSSDARDLYKADIYRALALPIGYVLHFRYPPQKVQEEIRKSPMSLIGQKGLIFFVSGNDQIKAEESRDIKMHSIRSVTIKDVVVDQQIDRIHFYLLLGDFVNATAHDKQDSMLPPSTFVSRITVDQSQSKWTDRVDAVKEYFPSIPFFFIEAVRSGAKLLCPQYSSFYRASTYSLYEESEYKVEIATYDPAIGLTGVSAENGSEDVELSIRTGDRIGAERNKLDCRLNTHSLSHQKTTSFTRLLGVNHSATKSQESGAAGTEYGVVLDWTVTRGLSKVVQFGMFSALTCLGLGLAKVATEEVEKFPATLENAGVAIASLIIIGIAASRLYVVFNKK